MSFPGPVEIREQLRNNFAAGVAAVDPVRSTLRALQAEPPPQVAPAIIALGKASMGMARAAVDWLDAFGLEPMGGVVVHHERGTAPHRSLVAVQGDHPHPGELSLRAADALTTFITGLPASTPVHVFLSGGTSALIAAPRDGLTPHDMQRALEQIHAMGLDIATMNSLRRQLTRWSNGRLAAALGARTVRVWVISDVMGNDLATIGSGPLTTGDGPDPNITALLTRTGSGLPESIRAALRRHDDAPIMTVPHGIVADAAMARDAVVAASEGTGLRAIGHREMLVGDARQAGESLSRWIHAQVRRHRLPDRSTGVLVTPVPREGVLHVWASETTVQLPSARGLGGRAQQFALAAARGLADLTFPEAATILVAGTDGRDGPTDAAGAIVDAGTLARMEALGINAEHALDRCDSYPALDAVAALFRTGHTGTNVADLVMVWLWNWY